MNNGINYQPQLVQDFFHQPYCLRFCCHWGVENVSMFGPTFVGEVCPSFDLKTIITLRISQKIKAIKLNPVMCTNVFFSPLTPIYCGSSECIFPKQIMEIRLKFGLFVPSCLTSCGCSCLREIAEGDMCMGFTIPAVSQFWKMS